MFQTKYDSLHFQSNLIASGATESEIFIWDLNNAKVPMSPGAKIQPSDDVTDLEWNKQGLSITFTIYQFPITRHSAPKLASI